MYEQFRLAIERKSAIPDPAIQDVDEGVQQTLHEMSQPLSSSAFLLNKAERLINLLSQLDELTQSNSNAVTYVGGAIARIGNTMFSMTFPIFTPFMKSTTTSSDLLKSVRTKIATSSFSRF
jgi:hypothetical protein